MQLSASFFLALSVSGVVSAMPSGSLRGDLAAPQFSQLEARSPSGINFNGGTTTAGKRRPGPSRGKGKAVPSRGKAQAVSGRGKGKHSGHRHGKGKSRTFHDVPAAPSVSKYPGPGFHYTGPRETVYVDPEAFMTDSQLYRKRSKEAGPPDDYHTYMPAEGMRVPGPDGKMQLRWNEYDLEQRRRAKGG